MAEKQQNRSSEPASFSYAELSRRHHEAELGGMAKQLALNCALVAREGNSFHLALEATHAQMRNKTSEERLKIALEQHLGAPVSLRFLVGKLTAATPADQRQQQRAERQQAAVERVNQDPNVRDMRETFDARIVAIHPLDATDG